MIQVGGHGDRICQCCTVTLTTDKVIPMQMDGEPCRLMPATIQIRCSHQALVVQKQRHQPTYTTRGPGRSFLVSGANQTRLIIFVISLKDYQAIPDDAIALRQIPAFYGSVGVKFNADLAMVRNAIETFNRSGHVDQPEVAISEATGMDCDRALFCLSDSWAFIDSTTAATRFFRIDQKKESSHFITDICNMDELFLIDSGIPPRLIFDGSITEGHPVPNGKQSEDSSPDCQSNFVDSKQEDRSGVGAKHSVTDNSPSKPTMPSELREKEAGLVQQIERITSEREDRREPKPLLSCSSTLDTKQCANVTSTMDLENEQLTHTIPLQQNKNQSDQDKAWHSENVRPRLATFRSISVVCDPREQNETLKSSSGVTGETTKTHRKTRSFDQTSESSMERVTDWLHVHSSCDDSICSSISERTYETELLPSDSERRPALSTNTERRDRAKYLETVDSLQIRLDRALLNASRKGNVQQIDALLEAGANILAVDERGRSSLHLTTKFGCDRAVRTLLKYASPEFLEIRE
nr:unnamed protein product [Fasciola hepatica]